MGHTVRVISDEALSARLDLARRCRTSRESDEKWIKSLRKQSQERVPTPIGYRDGGGVAAD